MNRMLICVVGLFLPLPLSGCQSSTPEEVIQCINDDDCPPTCSCAREIPKHCRLGSGETTTCAGTCNRETICNPGTECMREPGTVSPAFFSCQPVQGAGGAGGTGGDNAGGTGGDAGSGGADGCVAPPTPAACLSPPPDGLVAWWTFDANGTDIQSGLNGALRNGAMAGASGLVNGALNLDGNNDFVDVPDDAALTIQSGLTLDAWVNPTTLEDPMTSEPDDAAIVSKYNSSPGVAEVSWYFGHFGNGHLRLTVCEAWPADCTAVDTDETVLTESCWHLVAATFDATAAPGEQAKIYVDGAEVASSQNPDVNGTVQSIADSSVPVRVGTFTPIGGVEANFWHGLIDELEIYGRTLSPSEIADIYNAGARGKCK